jgi:hypothetical protein
MIFIRLLPVILSTLLYAAHVLRFNGLPVAVMVLILLLTLFIRKPWIIRLWQILLAFAALKWVIITVELVQMRINFEIPYLRLAIILIIVAVLNLFTVFWLQNKKIKKFYGDGGGKNRL